MYGAIGVGERGLITLNLVLYCSDYPPDILYKKSTTDHYIYRKAYLIIIFI